MTSGQRADQAPIEVPSPEADPGLEAMELAARISHRLSAGDASVPRQRLPTPRPPATT